MKKRILSLLLCAIMLCFVACESTVNTDSSPGGEVSQTDEDLLRDANFGGRTFTILQRPTRMYEFTSDDTASKLINDEIANRNALVEQRYGIKLQTMEVEGDWTTIVNFQDYVANTIQGGITDYDIISGYAVAMANLVSKNLFVDWRELEQYMNLDKEWWYQDFIDQMTINGHTFLLAGDINLTIWESMHGMFFNKDMVEANPDVGDLYQVVRDGEWTYDRFVQTLKAVSVGGDPTDEGYVYSYGTYTTTQIDVWQDAFNIPVTEKNRNGVPEITIGGNTKMVKTAENIYDLVNSTYTFKATSTEESLQHFGKGRSVFTIQSVGEGTKLKNYDIRYGILPLPKYDDVQDGYHSTCQDYYSVLAVPSTRAEDAEFIGTVAEALCYYSRKNVVPKYYEDVLQLRNTFDADTADMIDIIRDGLLCNFGYIYSMALNWPAHQLNVLINANSKEWVSNWDSKKDTFTSNLDELLEVYYK